MALILLIGSRTLAQETEPPPEQTSITFGFSYNYDTYVWTDSVLFRRNLGKQTVWGLDGGLSATQISSSDGLTRKQRFLNGRTFVDQRFSDRLSGGFSLAQSRQRLEELANRHYVFSDILTRLRYEFSPVFSLTQRTGFSVAERSAGKAKTKDAGFTSETEFTLRETRWLKRTWQGQGLVRAHQLQNVPSVEGRWSLAGAGELIFGDSLSFAAADHGRRTSYYPTLDDYETIARQKLHNGHFTADAVGHWAGGFFWGLTTDFTWRRESYELTQKSANTSPVLPLGLRESSEGYRLRLGNKLGGSGAVTAAYRYLETTEDFGADRKDQNSKTGELELAGYFRVGQADSIYVRGLWKVVSFVVPPDSGFYTDRDLATTLVDLGWTHTFTPVWDGSLVFSYRGLQQVFLSGQWSGNNNHNDIYLFMPRLSWRPLPGWGLKQIFRIQANYLSYDLEKGVAQPERSTLYRRAEAVSSFDALPLPPLPLELRYTYRYEDFGPLIWREKWNQQVSWDRRSHLAGIRWRWTPYRGWVLTPGVSFEQKKSYDHQEVDDEAVRVHRSTFVRRVIELSVLWRPEDGRDDLYLSGSRRIQRTGGADKDISDWVELTYRRHW